MFKTVFINKNQTCWINLVNVGKFEFCKS